MHKFFTTSQPIKKQYGRPEPVFQVQFAPAPTGSLSDHTFSPPLGGIVEWDDYRNVEVLLKNEGFVTQAAPIFSEAIARRYQAQVPAKTL